MKLGAAVGEHNDVLQRKDSVLFYGSVNTTNTSGESRRELPSST